MIKSQLSTVILKSKIQAVSLKQTSHPIQTHPILPFPLEPSGHISSM